MGGKHSACLLSQYNRRSENRLENFRRRAVVSRAEFTVGDVGPFIRYDWTVECDGILCLEATDDLEVIGGGKVVRGPYSYHATIDGGPNVVRYDGPDPEKKSSFLSALLPTVTNHHTQHHVHRYFPFEDKDEEVKVINEEDTPTLLDFTEDMIGWYYENRSQTQTVAS